MGSLIEELKRREAAARAEADRLRSRIEEFAEELARAEEQVSRLVIAQAYCAVPPDDPYWRFHLAREHQRLYPGTKQGQYALGA